MFKKVIANFMAVVLVLCSIGVCTEAENVEETEKDVNAELLYQIGILDKDYSDRLDEKVTRLEFAYLLVEMLGGKTVSGIESPFLDIHPMSPAGEYALTVYHLGLMNGYGDTFGGDDPIICGDALRVLLKAVKYDKYATMAGFEAALRKSGITEGVTVSMQETVTFRQMLYFVLKALTAEQMRENYSSEGIVVELAEGGSLLSQVHRIERVTGIVTGTEYTELYDVGMLSEGIIRLGNTEYKTNRDYFDLIGSLVDAYIQTEDGSEKLLYAVENDKTSSVTIDAGDFETFSGDKIVYYNGTKRLEKNLEKTANVIYNNRFLCKLYDFDLSLLDNMYEGSVIIKDNDNDGRFDAVVIHNIKTDKVKVFLKDTLNEMFSCETENIDMDAAEIFVVNKNGSKASESELKADCVLELEISADEKIVIVNILTKKINGSVEKIGKDTVMISGVEYQFSEKYTPSSFALGRGIEAYSNDNGVLVYVREEDLTDEWKYGVLVDCGVENEAFDNTLMIKFFDQNGEMKIYSVKKKIIIDRVTQKNMQTALTLLSASAIGERPLVMFKTNSTGELTHIDTCTPDTDARYGLTQEEDKASLMYKRLGTFGNGQYMLRDSTVVFSVPKNDEDDNYTMLLKAALVNDASYTVSIYNCDEYNAAGAIVVYSDSATTVDDSNILLVEGIERRIRNDEIVNYITGGYGSSLQSDAVWYRDGGESVPDVSPGDILQIYTYSTGELAAYKVLINGKSKFGHSEGSNKYSYSYGTVKKFDAATGGCLVYFDNENDTRISVLNEAKGYVVEESMGTRTVRVGSFGDIAEGKIIYIRERHLEPKEYVIFE